MTIDRLFISHQYIRGKGIEIGAWHNPFPVNPQMQVTYVDRYPYEKLIEMRDNDPTIKGKEISRVDVVDDGMWLEKFEDNSQDFVLSSHHLEHCWSPLTAIENHYRVLRPGGKIFYAVPDKRFTFDKERPISDPVEIALVSDDAFKTECEIPKGDEDELDDLEFYLQKQYAEYLVHVDKKYGQEILDVVKIPVKDLIQKDIHWFCWDAKTLMQTISRANLYFDIELFSRAGHENFVVLRKL